MWIIISFIFLIAALISQNAVWWILWGMMIIAHNIEYLGIQVKNLIEQFEKK